MTKISITAVISGKEEKFDFEVPQDISPKDWKQMTELMKMAMQQLAK